MNIGDIISRSPVPEPWGEADNIPWDEPSFSSRMLEQHLSQEHDRASRRFDIVDAHVDWIHNGLLGGRKARVLDLCCGPGLYTTRLALLGHECDGVDFSPASIEYAEKQSAAQGVTVGYTLGDVRGIELGSGYDLVMLIFGELNVFPPEDAASVLRKAAAALAPGGVLLLEPQRFNAVRETGGSPPSWYSSKAGLFSDRPHICLEEHAWDEETRTATTRFFVVDAQTGGVERHALTAQAYTDAEYGGLLAQCGFDGGDFLDALPGTPDEDRESLLAIVARKPE